MKIVILDAERANPGDLSWKELEALGELTVYPRTSLTDIAEITARIGDADAVFTNKSQIPAAAIEAAPNLKFIGVLATGYNIVDVAAASARGIPVCNVPTYSTMAVAQLTIALLLEVCHHAGHHDRACHEGRWQNSPDFCFWDFPLIEMAGKTMGIIGFGNIGRATGRIAKALGMRVIATGSRPCDEGREIAQYVTLDTLLSQSDVISLHCPLFPETQGLVNRESIAKMKDGVILLNTSRGPLIVEQDVADALNSGKIYAAGVDVVSAEPIRADNPLLTAKNLVMTPHIAWAPLESRRRLLEVTAGNLRAFLDGSPVNVVNP